LVRARTQKLGLAPTVVTTKNSQTVKLLEAHLNSNPTIAVGKTLAMVDNSALVPNSADGEAFLDAGASGTGEISVYIVREGDTLDAIAKMFNVSKNTIIWANSLKGSTVAVGQELVILPVSGVKHTVVKGDTVSSIAKKYSADASDILSYNNLPANAALTVGQVVIVPDGELGSAAASSGSSNSSGTCKYTASNYEKLLVNPCKYPSYPGYYAKPIPGAPKTQELHGYNGIDFGAKTGTTIGAAANGTVIVAKSGGYNGGYGSYVVVSHPNGTQTLYAHMSNVYVTVGQSVSQGQQIGAVGSTGKSTGPHLHFEIRGARNPF
jgi:LysM repeat protein